MIVECPRASEKKEQINLLFINFLKIHEKYFNVYLLNLSRYLNETILNSNIYVIKNLQ